MLRIGRGLVEGIGNRMEKFRLIDVGQTAIVVMVHAEGSNS